MVDQFNNPKATYRDTLGPAMEITEKLEADEYLARLINRDIVFFNLTYEEAYSNAMVNLGYFAGYYSRDTQKRVLDLFRANHPIMPVSTD